MNAFYASHLILIQQTAVVAILAMSFQVVLRSGVFSFAGAGFYLVGAYAVANLSKHGWPLLPALLVIVIACAALGYLLSIPFIRLRGLYLGMVTFAFAEILVVVAENGGGLTGGPVGMFGVAMSISTPLLFVIAAVAALLLSQLERRSLGRSLRMLSIDEQLARSMGIEVTRQRAFVFALSSALGALAGALNAITTSSVSPGGFGYSLVVLGLTMAVVGGIGSWTGAVIGGIIVTWFPDVFGFVGDYRTVVYGVLLILVVIFEPAGVLGLISRLASLVMRMAGHPPAGTAGDHAVPAISDATAKSEAPV
jgi:branched-chain amino acid transport system permease protein